MTGATTEGTIEERVRWAGRFGWMVGGGLGLSVGFALTYIIEAHFLLGRVASPVNTATRLSGVLVGAGFLVGALSGEALGSIGLLNKNTDKNTITTDKITKTTTRRYRLLGSAAGLSLAALGWALLVVSR